MNEIIQITTVVLIVSAASLCIALIYYLNKIVKSVQSVNNNIQELSANLKPLIQSTLNLSVLLFDSFNKSKPAFTEPE